MASRSRGEPSGTDISESESVFQYRLHAALAELRRDGLIGSANNGYCLVLPGYRAVREPLDVDQTIQMARVDKRAA